MESISRKFKQTKVICRGRDFRNRLSFKEMSNTEGTRKTLESWELTQHLKLGELCRDGKVCMKHLIRKKKKTPRTRTFCYMQVILHREIKTLFKINE